MKALLLAAGLGTRLRPFTFVRAKVALPLLNAPFLHYPLQYLYANRVSDVVINLHAHPETVRAAGGEAYEDMRISYSHEPEILGTAGAIRKAASLLDTSEPFVVMNGDMLLDAPLAAALDQHLQTNALVTLIVMPGHSEYKGLHFEASPDHGHLLLKGLRPEDGEKLHYTGLQIVSAEVVERIPPGKPSEIFTDVYPDLIRESKIGGFLYDGIWKEIGTLKQYLETSLYLLDNPLAAHLCPRGMTQSIVSPASDARSKNITNTVIMDHATVEQDAFLDRCLIGWETKVSGRHVNTAFQRGFLPWHII